MARRLASNRAIENFIAKYPDYKDRIYLHTHGRAITFRGKLHKETTEFREYTERAKIWAWLNKCRRIDEELEVSNNQAQIEVNQFKLL